MRSLLAMMFYIDYKCSSEPRFRKTLLVLTLTFVLFLWSPWRPLLCPVFGVCSAPVVRVDSAPQPRAQGRGAKHPKRPVPSPAPLEVPVVPSVQ